MEGGNLNIANINPFPFTNPSNCLNGTRKGIENALLGTSLSIVFVIGAPIKFGVDGYASYGVCGAVGGSLVGTVVGALGASVLILGGALSCVWQTAVGLFRTPNCIYSTMIGKHWDDDIQEWVTYDLSAETNKLSTMTDEEFFAIIKDKGSAYDVFSVATPERTESAPNAEDSSLRPKKNILDRELYDTLGLEPEATSSEIKKAYYIKARQSHPDRNPGDETAKANFQKIGQAYQVLADERTRTAYDTRGKASLESSRTMDAGSLYTLLFGSEAFEAIIGELSLSAQIKIMMDPTTRPPQLARFRQRKRELQCALTLLSKLEVCLSGEEELFLEKARKEAVELSESPLGCTLLGVIGTVYMQRASARLSTLSYIATSTIKTGTSALSTFQSLWHGLMAGVSALEMRSLHLEAEARQRAEDDKNHVSEAERKEREKASAGAMNLNAMYGPNPTPEVKEKVRKQTKHLTGHIFGLLWQMTKSDIETTLKHVCNKLLRDKSVSEATIEKRAKALYLLGQEYVQKAGSESVGLEDFLVRMGATTGMFGDNKDDESTPAGKATEGASSEGTGNPMASAGGGDEGGAGMSASREHVVQMVSKVETYSVRELKEAIALLGGDCSDCVEKADLRNRLNDLIAARLFTFDEECP